MKKSFLLALLLLMHCALPSDAQSQCFVTHFDEFSGMAQWYVNQIVQDNKGMMWFATWNGLNRYDGYQFECFKSRPGDGVDMPSDRIMNMLLDDDGNLLCLIDSSVYKFDVDLCQYSKIDKKKEAALFKRFHELHEQELYHYNSYIYEDLYGTVWTIGLDGTLTFRKGTADPQPYQPNQPLKGPVRYCTTDREGNLWLRSNYGVYQLVFRQKPYTLFPLKQPSQIRCFCVDSRRRYWVSSRDDAAVMLFSSDNRLLGYLGKDGHLHQQYTRFGSPVYCMMQDSQGVFWLGSKPNGLFRMTEKADGTFRLDHFVHTHDPGSLRSNNIYDLKEDQAHRLWIATFDGGLHCLERPDDSSPMFLHKDNGLQVPKDAGVRVRQMLITREGVLLAATTQGLLVGDVKGNVRQTVWRRHLKEAHRSSSLSNNATMYVAEDRQHRVFVCTESGGVNMILSNNLLAEQLDFRHFDTSSGLASDVALSAVADGDDLLIVSNNQLIMLYLNKMDEESAASTDSYLWKEHFRFSDATPTLLPDGRFIFGLQDGAFTTKQGSLRKSTFVPPIALTGISVQNRTVDRSVNALDTLTLQPYDRNVTVWFAALDYSGGGEIKYIFRLRGSNEQWNSIGTNHSVTFLDLHPGTYQLEIRSTNSDGVWVDNMRKLTILVLPSFWETKLAKFLYVLLLALIVWGVLLTRRHIIRLKRQQRETLEAYMKLMEEARNQKSEHASWQEDNNSHKSESSQADSPISTVTVVPPSTLSEADKAFMQRAVSFIEEHLGDTNININKMADATATSRSGLYRKMKSLMGVTPLDFIHEARIRRACQLLKEGKQTADVAYNCGFSDPKYFSKCFKAVMGVTPKEYRERALNRWP